MRNCASILSWAVVQLLVAAVVAAQPADESPHFVHRSWTVESGLPQNTVTAIARTTDGYVWLGTVKGVVRFDGVRFVGYEKQTTPGLVGDRITALLGTTSGDLWIGTEWSGLGRYSNGVFSKHNTEETVPEPFIRALFEDSGGSVWIGATGAAYRYDGAAFRRYTLGSATSPVTPQSFLETTDGEILAAGGGLFRFNGSGFEPIEVHGFEGNTGIYEMREATDGSLWLATWDGVVHVSPAETRTYPFGQDPTVALTLDHDGLPWAGVRGQGLMRFDGAKWLVAKPLGFIRDLLLDEEGLLWVAGGDDGLHRLQPALFQSVAGVGAAGGESVLRVVADKDGSVWTGSLYAGMFRFQNGKVQRFTWKDGLQSNAAYMFTADGDGVLWVGSGSKLYRFNGGRFVRVAEFESDANPYGSSAIRAMEGSPHGGIWLGMPGLVAHFDGSRLSRMTPIPELRGQHPSHLHEDSRGDLWVSADLGRLCRIENGTPLCFGPAEGIPPYVIRDVHENPDGTFWFGTYGGGLCQFVEDRARCIGEREGLPDNTVHEIFDDTLGYVWFSSNRGISRIARTEIEAVFSRSRSRITPDTYGVTDGMPSSECNEGGWQTSDGRLWFPTMRGLTYVDPQDAIDYRAADARTYIESLVVDGSEAPMDDPVELPPGSDRLAFEFTGVQFSAPEKLRFRSMLIGHDDDWVSSGSSRTATYTNLAPGPYTFVVQSAVGSADWSAPASLALTLRPYFHQTWWFRLLVGLSVLAFLTFLYRYRVGRLLVQERLRTTEAEARRLAELDSAKNRFFANISHEFRTPLTLIISPVSDALEKADLTKIERRRYSLILSNAQRLLRLVNQLLDLSKLDAGRFKLARSASDLVPFVKHIVSAFMPMAERNDVHLEFRSRLSSRHALFDANVLTTVIGNLVANALKFTPSNGKVWVTLAEDEHRVIEIVVKDTGPGIPRAALHRIFDRFEQVESVVGSDAFGSGIGLALARELTELHGGVLLVESEEGFGSAFILRIALEQPEADASLSNAVPGALSVPDGGDPDDEIEPTSSGAAKDRPSILVIDDNEDIRELVVGLLASGFNLVQARNGEEGLRAARHHKPDLILTDVMMPGIDGLALCKQIRSEPGLKHIPIVLLTARAGEDAVLEGLAAGADDYIVKPFHAETLRAKALNLIQTRRRMRDQFSRELVVPGSDLVIRSEDQSFAERLIVVVDTEMGNASFNVAALADELGMSRRQLTRRTKAVFGSPPSDVILQHRLERASRLLHAKAGTVSEIAYRVGFRSASHFGLVFRNAYGHSPTEHIKSGT